MKRFKLSRSGSRKVFKKAHKIHGKNLRGSPMRGGIRL